MELIKFKQSDLETTCPNCGHDSDCPEYYTMLSDCPGCGESLTRPEMHILLYTAPYHGENRPHSHAAKLFVDGLEYASVHVDGDLSDVGGDVAWLQLHYIHKEKQNDKTARIIAEFAKWARFQWVNVDKQSELPTLVRLMGIRTHKEKPFPYQFEKYIALPDATKISAEHLDLSFTTPDV